MNKKAFVDLFLKIAREGYRVQINRDGLRQIDFGHKKLHEGHLEKMYPEILQPGVHIPTLINEVAPGRPCAHRPVREIMARLHQENLIRAA
jgi:hypothetical protein